MYLGQIDFQHGLGIENPIPQGDSRISRAQDHRELRNSGYKVTPFRAEDLEPGVFERKGWFVDVFRPSDDGEVVDDPILDIVEQIAWSDRSLMLGLTGGTGVGKTTQIGRLARVLGEEHAIACVVVDYGDVNELSSPPDVTDFLLSVVGGFAREAVAADRMPKDWDAQGVGKRMLEILKRLKVPDVEIGVASTASITVLDLLREDETFRARLRTHLAGRVSEVIQEVRVYAGEIASAILGHHEQCAGVALVVDSTEKLAAPGSAQEKMHTAVRNLFVQTATTSRSPRSTRSISYRRGSRCPTEARCACRCASSQRCASSSRARPRCRTSVASL